METDKNKLINEKIRSDIFWRVIAILALLAFCVIGYLNASRERYRMISESVYVLDTWTGNIKNIENQLSNH